MIDATHLFTDRIAKLEREIDDRRREQAMLSRFQRSLGSFPYVLRDTDRFSPRTATKFELLARVVDYLNRPDPFLYGGASTRELYDVVTEEIRDGKRRSESYRVDSVGVGRDKARPVTTPLEENRGEINYNTFRSYLARFRDEGRIFFNADTRRWRITEREIIGQKPRHSDREDAYD